MRLMSLRAAAEGRLGRGAPTGSSIVWPARVMPKGGPTPVTAAGPLVSLTPQGRRRFRKAFLRLLNWLRRTAGKMSSEELSTVIRFLSGLGEVAPPGWRPDATTELLNG
jgi:hypothetical protein